MRRAIEEYEADLYKVPMPKFFRREMGEVERKKYADGIETLMVKFAGLKIPGPARVSVVIDGHHVCRVLVEEGRTRFELSTANGDTVPEVANGQMAEIQYKGQALLQGTFRLD